MVALLYLIPLALLLGGLGLAAFVWSLRSGQYEDLEGAAHRVLLDEDEDAGITPRRFWERWLEQIFSLTRVPLQPAW
jgi:cbb3-type cytochrome oxidase maturation protein